MIGLPIAMMSFTASAYDMHRLTPIEELTRQIGQYDAQVECRSATPRSRRIPTRLELVGGLRGGPPSRRRARPTCWRFSPPVRRSARSPRAASTCTPGTGSAASAPPAWTSPTRGCVVSWTCGSGTAGRRDHRRGRAHRAPAPSRLAASASAATAAHGGPRHHGHRRRRSRSSTSGPAATRSSGRAPGVARRTHRRAGTPGCPAAARCSWADVQVPQRASASTVTSRARWPRDPPSESLLPRRDGRHRSEQRPRPRRSP